MHGAGGARLRRGAEELKLDIYVKKVFRYLPSPLHKGWV